MIALLLLLLQQPAVEEVKPKTAFLEGSVVAAGIGTPIAKATVQVMYEEPPDGKGSLTSQNRVGSSVITDTDGRFRLEAKEGVRFHLGVMSKGYVSVGQAFGAGPMPSSYKLTGDKGGVLVRLDAEGILSGRLFDPELEKPIAKVTVLAYRRIRNGPSEYWIPDHRGTSGEDGRFRIEALEPGDYRLQVDASLPPKVVAAPKKSGPSEWIYPATYFPGVSEFSNAATVTLQAGTQLDYFDMKLTRAPAFTLRGSVRADGVSGTITFLAVTTTGGGGQLHRSIGQLPGAGEFEIQHLPAGQFKLTAFSSEPKAADRFQAVLDLNVTEDLKDVDLILRPGVPVTVKVASFGDKPVDGDPLLKLLKVNCGVQFAPIQRSFFDSDGPRRCDETAKAEFKGIFEEPLRLFVTGLPNGWVVRQVLYNGQRVEQHRLQVNLAAPSHSFEVLVSPVSNAITGDVRFDGKPAAGAMVLGIREPLDAELAPYRASQAKTGADGRYNLVTLIPGSWRVIAVPPGSAIDRARELILAGGGQKIEVTETSSVTLNLEAAKR